MAGKTTTVPETPGQQTSPPLQMKGYERTGEGEREKTERKRRIFRPGKIRKRERKRGE